jgi:ribosomal protein S18 acetylase RimI-like enzyme
MRIVKATRKDFEDYLRLRRIYHEEYMKEIRKKERYDLLKKSDIEKEYDDFIKKRNMVVLFALEDGKKIGYLMGLKKSKLSQKEGYIGDVFVLKEHRKKGYAKKLISEFIKILNKKGVRRFRLGVYIKNKRAIELYKKIGFEIDCYDMKLKTK